MHAGGQPLVTLTVFWLIIALIFLALAIFDSAQVGSSIQFTLNAVLHTLPYMSLAVAAIGFLKATRAEKLVASAFQGNETRMIFLASLVGGISPFCSCEIISFIAALLGRRYAVVGGDGAFGWLRQLWTQQSL